MQTQPSRRYKQSTRWYFRVGQYANDRSHGGGGSRRNSSSKTRWSMDDFHIIENVGKGAFGLVSKAKDTTLQGDSVVALKEIMKQDVLDRGSVGDLRAEVEIQTRYVKCMNAFRCLFCTLYSLSTIYHCFINLIYILQLESSTHLAIIRLLWM